MTEMGETMSDELCPLCGSKPWTDPVDPSSVSPEHQVCAECGLPRKLWERLKAELDESTALQPCGHSSRWMAYRNPVDVTSTQFCLFCELADARKAALSLYTSLLAGFSREQIIRSALGKWPWLGPAEPFSCEAESCINDEVKKGR